MYITAFEQYSSTAREEIRKNDELTLFENMSERLLNIKTEQDAREYIKMNFGIKDDIRNFAISSEILINMVSGEKFFSITLEYKNLINSYNFEKNIAGCKFL